MLTVDDLLEMRKAVAAAQLLTSGAFEKELKVIAERKAELEKIYGVIPELQAAKEAREATERALAAAQVKIAAHEKVMAEAAQTSAKLQASAKELFQQAEQELARVKKLQADTETYKKNLDTVHAKRMKELDDRAAVLSAADARIATDRKELEDRVRKIKALA